uniref:Uncharacterized protein n=1 Tax=Anguilla anguilla TaxID=7936 RepID=A0A0E9W7V3_ANGAN
MDCLGGQRVRVCMYVLCVLYMCVCTCVRVCVRVSFFPSEVVCYFENANANCNVNPSLVITW